MREHLDNTKKPGGSGLGTVSSDESPLRQAMRSDFGASLRGLAAFCGGTEHLESLTTHPLDPVPINLDVTHHPDAERLGPIVEIISSWAVVALDDEERTVVARVLRRAIDHPDNPLGVRSKPSRVAAGVVWMALRGNNRIGRRARWSSEDIWRCFGVSSCTDIGIRIARTLGMERDRDLDWTEWPSDPIALGHPELLVSAMRRWLIVQRDAGVRAALTLEAGRDQRRLVKPLGDGTVRVTGREVHLARVIKGMSTEGRGTVMLIFGDDPTEPDDVLGLSVPDARRLAAELDVALRAPWVEPRSVR